MKYSIVFLMVFTCKTVLSQQWHAAGDSLIEPRNPNGYYITVAYLNKYEWAPIKYVTANSKHLYNGYKLVYILNGYYTDNARTRQLFLNARKKRIYSVERYSFK